MSDQEKPTKPTQANQELRIHTALGEDAVLLASFRYAEELGRPFRLDVVVEAARPGLKPEDLVGTSVTLTIVRGDGKSRFINGVVCRVSQSAEARTDLFYELAIHPRLWLLSRTSDCRIFQPATAKTKPVTPLSIVKDVLEEHLVDVEDRTKGTYPETKFTVQYRETDLNFVSRLMEKHGIYYFFEHENGRHVMVLVDEMAQHKELDGHKELVYHHGAGMVEDSVYEWRVDSEIQTEAVALNDFDMKAPGKNLRVSRDLTTKRVDKTSELYDYPGEYYETAHGETLVKVRAEELGSHGKVYSARTDVRGVVAGGTFELKDPTQALRKDGKKSFLVVATSVEASVAGYGSAGERGTEFSCVFRCISTDRSFRPARITPRPIVTGPQSAIVVGPQDEEIHTDELGRVKVRFHWDRDHEADDKASCFIRVSQAWAGKGWGAVFLPRVGHEVVVEFYEGDPDRPVITGRVYNEDHKPPYDLPANKTMSTIKSLSSKDAAGFNELRFEDKKDAEQIFVHAQRNLDVRVRATEKETTYGNREVRVGWEKDGKKGGSFNTLVRLDQNTIVQTGRYEQIDDVRHETVKKDVIVDHQANQTTTVKETAQLNAKKVIVETSDEISHTTNKSLVKASSAIDHKAGQTYVVEGGQTFSAKGGMDSHLEGGMNVHIKAGMKVNIEAPLGISLKCGGNAVVLDPSGVSIQGIMVKINMGAAAGPAQAAKSAKDASPFQAKEIEEPIEALVADDGKPGKKGTGKAKPRTRKKRTPDTQKPPPYPPPPPPPKTETQAPPPATGPTPPTSDKPCGIKELELQCEHKRKHGPSNVLQVVAGASVTDKLEKKFAGITVSLERKTKGKDGCTAKVTVVEEKNAKRKQIAVREPDGAPPESAWVSTGEHKFEARPPADDDYFPINGKPKVYRVHGRGCDDVSQMFTVESYPSQQVSVKLKREFFEGWGNEVTRGWEEWGTGVMKALGVSLKPKLTPPTGSLEASWGWAEDKDWQAYFEIAVTAALDPVIGVGIELKVSIGTLIYNGLGVPPPLSSLLADHVADIFFTTGAEAKATLKGGPKARFYAAGHERIVGELTLGGEGKLYAKLTAKVGSDYVLSAAVTAGGETEIVAQAKGEFERSGVYVTPKVTLKPLTVSIVVECKAFKVYTKEKKVGEWTPWDDVDLYKGARTRLLPGDDK
ncbi:MAG: type VI secretion system tip protein VgrG [Phycisphaerae bacterium]|nr:type VI secretion system tip protein VgrG [Phycisphaerae bacterium]